MENSATFSKNDSMAMKGIALLFMLFYHLFYRPDRIALCDPWIVIDGKPLAMIIAQCLNPIFFFMFLSGYGLYINYSKVNPDYQKKNVIRVGKLYLKYWLILLFFVPLGAFVVGPDIYPGSFVKILSNLLPIESNSSSNVFMYYGASWFLLPWAVLVLLSGHIFKVIDKFSFYAVPAIAFVYCLGFFLLMRHFNYVFNHNLPMLACNCAILLSGFCLGAYSAKYIKIGKFRLQWGGGILLGLFVLRVLSFKLPYNFYLVHPFFSMAVTLTIVSMNRGKIIDGFLCEIGKKSTSMWLIHGFIYLYFFKDFIYGFKYPLVIFIVLVAITYAVSTLIDLLYNKIQSRIFKAA